MALVTMSRAGWEKLLLVETYPDFFAKDDPDKSELIRNIKQVNIHRFGDADMIGIRASAELAETLVNAGLIPADAIEYTTEPIYQDPFPRPFAMGPWPVRPISRLEQAIDRALDTLNGIDHAAEQIRELVDSAREQLDELYELPEPSSARILRPDDI